MQKWEYLEVVRSTLETANTVLLQLPPTAYVSSINGQSAKGERGHPEFYRYITELGEQGWELVSCHSKANEGLWVFKRPKP